MVRAPVARTDLIRHARVCAFFDCYGRQSHIDGLLSGDTPSIVAIDEVHDQRSHRTSLLIDNAHD